MNSPALESGTITPFCSGSGCFVQRERTRRAARLPAVRWSASAAACGPAGVRAGGCGAERCAGVLSRSGTCTVGRPYPGPRTPVNPRPRNISHAGAALGYGRLSMPLVVDVPLNTAIADLDEALRTLLRRELKRHGFEGVDVAFDAPSKEWSGKLTNPTVDLFLYDLREAGLRAQGSPDEVRTNGTSVVTPPALQLELTFAVTAWTKAVEDEHRLLSQVLAILFSYRRLPPEVLDGALDDGALLAEAETSVGRPREEKADFWTSVGGQYKASIDFVVHTQIASGAAFVRGPEVRTQTIRTRISDGPVRTMTEFHRIAGTVADADGQPVADAWVAVPSAGLWTATGRDGRFRFDRIQPGAHTVVARTADGGEAQAALDVPGGTLDLTIGDAKPARARRSR